MGEFVPAWASAIAQFEGFFKGGSLASRNHNPGNLKYAGQAGTVGKDSRGFAIFQDDPTGWQGLYNQLAKYIRTFPGYSILQITAHYLGQNVPTVDAEGNAFTYANFVAGQLGVAVTATLADLSRGIVSLVSSPSEQVPDDQSQADQTVIDQGQIDQATVDQAIPGSQGNEPSGGSGVLLMVVGVLLFFAWQRSMS